MTKTKENEFYTRAMWRAAVAARQTALGYAAWVRAQLPEPKLATHTVYTMGYFPFTMGGPVWQPIAIDYEAHGPHPLGQGYKGWVVTAPNGNEFIAEDETGAFVGPSLAAVRQDIAEGDPEKMAGQIAEARTQSAGAHKLEPEEFWRRLKCLD